MIIPFDIRVKVSGAKFLVNSKSEDYRIRKYGGERNFVKKLIDDLDDNSVLIDIGASVGLVTVLAAKVANRVYAIEPDPDVTERLSKNISINNLQNVDVIRMCAGNSWGVTRLFKQKGMSASTNPVGKPFATARMETIDSLSITPTHIKIDVEGGELDVLHGAQKTISKSLPKIWLELHPDKVKSTASIFRFMDQWDYDITYMRGRANEVHLIFEAQ